MLNMNTTEQLESLLNSGFDDVKSLVKQGGIESLERDLSKLEEPKRKGYTIPHLDTIGMNLNGRLAYTFKGC